MNNWMLRITHLVGPFVTNQRQWRLLDYLPMSYSSGKVFLIGSFQLDVEPLCVAKKVLTSRTIHFPVAQVNLSVHILLGRWLIGCSHLSNSVLVI